MINDTEALLQQVQLMSKLKEKLSQEQQLIVARDADGLMSLINEKEQLLDQIAQNESLLNAINDASLLSEEQIKLAEEGKELLLECQRQTDINARVVEKNQVRIQRLRNLMIAVRSKESMTYTSKGKTQGNLLGDSVKA